MKLTQQEALGTIGEIYYQALFGGELSSYKFDGEKDLVQTDGKHVEIKTQSRVKGYDCFTVNKAHKNNLEKCKYVDRLIFIEYSLSDTIIIYECVDRRSVFSMTVESSEGTRVMACWPIDKMTVLKKIVHPKLAEIMRNFSKSETLGYYE